MKILDLSVKYINTKTGDISSKVYDIIKSNKSVSINTKSPFQFSSKKIIGRDGNTNFFKEIKLLEYPKYVDKDFWGSHTNSKPEKIKYEKFIEKIMNIFERSILDSWNPKKFNVIFHTSGLDSRILSGTLRKIYKENGDKWLGDFLFVCWGPESYTSRKIIDYEGWNGESHFLSIDADPSENYHKNINFDTAYESVNGICNLPISKTKYIQDVAKNYVLKNYKNFSKNDLVFWSAGFFNETFEVSASVSKKSGKKIIDVFWELIYGSVYSQMIGALSHPIVYPLLSDEMFDFVARYFAQNSESTARQDMIRSLDHNLLDGFKRVKSSKLSKSNQLSADVAQRIYKDYKKSWYGSKLKPNAIIHPPSRINKNNDVWYNWTAASLVQYLINNNCKIK